MPILLGHLLGAKFHPTRKEFLNPNGNWATDRSSKCRSPTISIGQVGSRGLGLVLKYPRMANPYVVVKPGFKEGGDEGR